MGNVSPAQLVYVRNEAARAFGQFYAVYVAPHAVAQHQRDNEL